MQGSLFCNASKCRRPLTSGSAWVTSCCHVFCYEDGKSVIENSKVCPACSTQLNRKHDIISLDTNPNKTYKTMVLMGQRPEVVMDICQAAISAWVYQYNNELMCRQSMIQRKERKLSDLQRYCEKLIVSLQEENKILKNELTALKKKYDETSSLLSSKVRQCKKLEAAYHELKHSSSAINERRQRGDGGGDTRSENDFFLRRYERSSGAYHGTAVSPLERYMSHSSTPKKKPLDFPRPTPFQTRTPDIGLFDSFSRKFCEKMQE